MARAKYSVSDLAKGAQCPLGPEHCAQLDSALQAIPHVLSLCDQCEAAGLDMTHFRNTLTASQQLAQGLKKSFFPEQPS